MNGGITAKTDINKNNKVIHIKFDGIFLCIGMSMLLLTFIYLIWAAGIKEFWYDEVALIGYIRSDLSPGDVLHYYQTIEATNTPLYALIIYGFYHLLPPENIWILLPGIIMTLLGVWILVRLADRTLGRSAAYTVLVMCVFSTTILNRMALELRAYSLLFMGAVLTTDYLIRLKDKVNIKNLIFTSVFMSILAYSHYFGVLYLIVLGIEIFIYIIYKKKDTRIMLPFIIAAISFLPWFVVTMRATNVDTSTFWIQPPKLLALPETVGYLLGGSYLLCVLYGVGFLWLLYDVITGRNSGRTVLSQDTGLQHPDQRFNLIIYALTGPAVMAVIFSYSRWINPGGGLYENRYFIVILPCIILTASYGINRIMEMGSAKNRTMILTAGIIFLMVVGIFLGIRSFADSKDQYARYSYAAEHIIMGDDLGNDDVLLVCASYDDVGYAVLEGWYDYYLLRRGYKASNILMTRDSSLDAVLSNMDSYRKVYVVGDTDHITYQGEEYRIVMQEDFYKYTVLERCN